mmetsp:Transcript_12757/g.30370  ORF Transcript_12757/g.30370 Transcript_12757/m.30370 type:complete len:670 (-) Transcript_12757:275-2284(-)
MQSSTHYPSSARELRQYAKTTAGTVVHATLLGEDILMSNGELQRDEVEPIADRGHHDNIGGPEEGHALLQPHLALGALLELNRPRPFVVDVLHHRQDLGLGPEVVIATFERGDAHLHQHDLADPLLAAVEEALQAQHLERDALEAFHPIDGAEDDLAAELIADGEGPLHRRGVLKDLVQYRRFDAGVDGGDGDVPAVVVNGQVVTATLVGDHAVIQPEQPAAARQEVPRVLKEVEPDLVGVEHAPEEVLAAPHRAEDLAGGEGGVEEDADLGHGDAAGEEAGEDEEVEAVDPDQVALVEALDDGVGKLPVDGRVRRPEGGLPAGVAVDGAGRHVVHGVLGEGVGRYRPGLLLLVAAVPVTTAAAAGTVSAGSCLAVAGVDRRHVVEDGPQHALAEAVVHLAEQTGLDPDGDAVEGFQTALDEGALLDRHSLARAAILPDVAVPAAPLDDADARDAEVGLHAEEGLVVPVGGPADLRRLSGGIGRVRRLGPVEVDGQEGAGHDEAVGGIEMDLLGGGSGGRFVPVERFVAVVVAVAGAAGTAAITRAIDGVAVVGHGLGGEPDGLLLVVIAATADLVLRIEVALGVARGAGAAEGAERPAAVRIVAGVAAGRVEGGDRRRLPAEVGPDADVLQFGMVRRLAEDVGELVQLVPGQEAEGELVRSALVRVCA